LAERPLLTVAIPTYNGARHLADAIRGVRAQEGVEFDLIVCDDRSEDTTLEIVRAEAGDRARVEVNSERLGLAGNWNRCVTLSRTPWVAVFHQDDVMRAGHLAAHERAIAAAAPLGLVASAAEVIDERGNAVPPSVVTRGDLGPADRTYPPGAFVAELAAQNPLRCSATTLRAEAHASVGGFDARYRYVVDWDFWLRVARSWSVAWLAQPTVAVRWHSESETHRFKSGATDLEEAERLLGEIQATDADRLEAPRTLRRTAERRLARAYLNRVYDALRGRDSALARHCLRRALSLWPGILGHIIRDPRLAARLAALLLIPEATKRHRA
jgi:GT2 family glycosyltransferase